MNQDKQVNQDEKTGLDPNKNVDKKKTVLAVGIILICCALFSFRPFRAKEHRQAARWDLKEALVYDNGMKEQMEQLLESEVDVVFWKETELDTVKNPDYNRSIEVKTMGVAGDASVLFPGSNSLAAGETGYCLLGEDTACKLFGSTRVNGRSVQINGKLYHVAGIEYQEKELCVYELAPDGQAEITCAAICSKNRQQLEIDKRRLELGVGVLLVMK